MKKYAYNSGYALPAVLILSTALLMMATPILQNSLAIRQSLQSQYYTQLAREAAESGQVYATYCLQQNSYIAQWSDAKPLMPNTDCAGNVRPGSCPSKACYVMLDTGVRSTFTVKAPASGSTGQRATATGTTELTTSANLVYRSYTQTTVSTTTTNSYGSLAVATSIEGYWTSAPQGFLLEDGAAVSRTTYAALFAVIGTTYGAGDGSTTFNVPDSRGRTAVNKSADVEFATIGQKTGSKTETLTTAQIPSHVHGLTQSYSYVSGGNPATHGFTGTASYNTGATGGGGSHNNIQPSIVKMFAIKYASVDSSAATSPAASSINGYWSAVPTDYLLEDGSAVSRTTYADLFAVIGTTYGAGDGSTTFNLPDSRGRAAVNKSPSDTEFDTMGEKPGSKTETLTVAQIPSHVHGLTQSYSYGGVASPGGSPATHGFTGTASYNTGATGGGLPHNEIQPSITKMFAIKYTVAAGAVDASPKGTSLQGYWAAVPAGYLAEDGSAISRTTYAGLFAAISTAYGAGDGSTTFNVPDSRGRVAVNRSPSDSEFDVLGEKYGTKTETLALSQLPSHVHGLTQSYSYVSGGNPATHGFTGTASYNTGATGGGGSHNNIQPSIVKMFAIKY